MKPLMTPDDIREYIKELMLKNISKYSFDNIELYRELTEKVIIAIDLYIDLKIELSKCSDKGMNEFQGIPEIKEGIEIAREGFSNKRKNERRKGIDI